MGKTKGDLIKGILGILLLLNRVLWSLPNLVEAQAQHWLRAEQMRQAYERQQWLQWQQQETLRRIL